MGNGVSVAGTRRQRRYLVAAVVVAVVAWWPAAPRAEAGLPILGFQSEDSPASLIAADAPGLGSVGVDGLNLTGAPGAVSRPTVADRRQLAAARHAGLPAVLLVGNYSDRLGDFSEPLAWRTLRSPQAIASLARTLGADVRAAGWDGISVDLESLRKRDREGLAAFLADLRSRLPADDSLTVCVSNETSARAYEAGGYDLRRIEGSVDQVVLMAYDQHGPWERTPGPVAADHWVRAGLRTLMRTIPAREIDLGVAGYGYVWRRSGAAQVSDARARWLVHHAHAHARWIPSVGEWTARLPDGAVLWWSDHRSLGLRTTLAASHGLHGVAVWSLGLSDPIR
jgi:spore germination protein YaaH